jgi:hydroxymethylbilane synthase
METIRLTGRGSRLSLLQMEKVKLMIKANFPMVEVEFVTRDSRGDELVDIPLQTMEGSDFFTSEVFKNLTTGEADIAVHSLKDMSAEHFFGGNEFAIIDRDDNRDIAIFNRSVIEKLTRGETIVIGTCSPRREIMAVEFLRKALPQMGHPTSIVTKPIRGNVETRLLKLDKGEYDATILATAGLNRLLASDLDRSVISDLLVDKRTMLLPLIECVPAPCQGAIVAEAVIANRRAVEILQKINNTLLKIDCSREKQEATNHGAGCLQKFGVTTIQIGNTRQLYAAGTDKSGNKFSSWIGVPDLDIANKKLFSTTDHMGGFFSYRYSNHTPTINEKIVYIANYKALNQESLVRFLKNKKVWVSGTKTWFESAKKGIWVEGSADAFGLEFLQRSWQMPLYGIAKKDVAVLTNEQSVSTWQQKGWRTYGTYQLIEERSPVLEKQIAEADIIFWTSYRQYASYKSVLKDNVQHSCPYGETAEQFKAAGIRPVVYPNIKAFLQWKQTSAR